MNVAWVRYDLIETGGPGSPRASVARGYVNFARFLREATAEHLDLIDTPEGETAHPRTFLHLCPPHLFRPIAGKRNVLFTMWEADRLPDEVVEALKRADDLIVPSQWCAEVWASYGLKAEVVTLGAEAEFLGASMARPIGRMRILTLGSKLGRKGWQLVAPAWSQAFGEGDDVELYIKVIGDGTVTEHFDGHVIVDQRDLSRAELVQLYESSHAFLCTSYGEGFGLIVLEAMAAGCLVISPAHTGLTEFVSPETAIVVDRTANAHAWYGCEFDVAVPSPGDIATALRRVLRDWGSPELEALRTEGARVAQRFTWEASGRRLAEVLRGLTRERVAA